MKYSIFRALVILGFLAAFVTGCSRDPNVRKQKYLESGERYFAKGKYREAAIQFANAVQIDPQFAQGSPGSALRTSTHLVTVKSRSGVTLRR